MKKLCTYLGGSHLYGLETPESDIDYRGVYAHTDPIKIFRFSKQDSIVKQSEEVDSSECEIVHFLRQVTKGGTNALECLFAPIEKFTYIDPFFQRQVINQRMRLIDSEQIFKSIGGYAIGELRKALGYKTGTLGGKRKDALDKNGYSPKNFSHLFRLLTIGKHYMLTGEYTVNLKEAGYSEIHNMCRELKLNPQNFTVEDLTRCHNELRKEFDESINLAPKEVLERKTDFEYIGKVLQAIYA